MANKTINTFCLQYEDIDMANVYECHEGSSQFQNQETFNDQGLQDSTDISFYDVYERDGDDAAEAKQKERSSSSDADTGSEISMIEWEEDSEDFGLLYFPESNCDNIEAAAKAQRSLSSDADTCSDDIPSVEEFSNENQAHFNDNFCTKDDIIRGVEDNGTNNVNADDKDVVDRVKVMKNMLNEKQQQLVTKKDELRKRKLFILPKNEREILKTKIKQTRRCVKKSCLHKKCMSIISEKRRREINSQFWSLNFSAQCAFVHSTISRVGYEHRRPNSRGLRQNTFSYHLKNETGQLKSVCKIFYLTTLGYGKSNDSFIRELLGKENFKKPLRVRSEQGKHTKTPMIDRDTIIRHINSFNPTISHHHAPKKKYLHSDITITAMYADLNTKHPGMCSYDVYRQVVSVDLNISFAHLGNEECESCERFELHSVAHPSHTKEAPVADCSDCSTFVLHRKKYTASREVYASHQNKSTADHHRTTGDLQKVIMLPRMDMFKEVIFCPRLIAFNESFVPIGDNNHTVKPLAVVWHEAISGRKREDIISTFYAVWTLFGFLVHLINSNVVEAEFIEFVYFEPGHTFMSADFFHHQVEQSLKTMKKVYDFESFKTAVQKANSQNVTVANMNFQDFYQWPTYIPLLLKD